MIMCKMLILVAYCISSAPTCNFHPLSFLSFQFVQQRKNDHKYLCFWLQGNVRVRCQPQVQNHTEYWFHYFGIESWKCGYVWYAHWDVHASLLHKNFGLQCRKGFWSLRVPRQNFTKNLWSRRISSQEALRNLGYHTFSSLEGTISKLCSEKFENRWIGWL